MALAADTEYDNKILRHIITAEFPEDPLAVTGERNFGQCRPALENNAGTPVQEFFRNTTVLVTGGTGFLGIVLTEKLLRSCPHMKRLYVLVRVKKEKSSQERHEEILRDKLFKRLEYEFPRYREKLTVISGDVEQPNLGISSENQTKLLKEVNIIFHCAATVRFHESLYTSVKVNAIGTRRMMKLAKDMKNLKVFVYVSTAFSNCPRFRIEEKVYPMNIDYKHLLKLGDQKREGSFRYEETRILQNWPNNYVFSKALAECVIENENDGLPIAIFRPSVVLPTYKEPIRGWINNTNGPIGALLAYGFGIIRVNYGNLHAAITDPVPVDYVVNGLICSARETAMNHFTRNSNTVPVYNFVNGGRNVISWKKAQDMYWRYDVGKQWPFSRMLWHPWLISVQNRFLYKILSFFLHQLFGYIFDFFAILIGHKTRLTKIYKKLDFAMSSTHYFANRSWLFEMDGMKRVHNNLSAEDKKIFFFNIEEIKWKCYMHYIYLGLRLYLLKDGVETLPKARNKFKRLSYIHRSLQMLFHCLLWLIGLALLKYFCNI